MLDYLDMQAKLPNGFVYLQDPRMVFSMDYATPHNFMGRIVKDYHSKVCILTEAAASALIKVQDILSQRYPNHGLKIFDAYRPVNAVNDFKDWSKDFTDIKMKQEFYPSITKLQLFEIGYIAEHSSHSRGSTVDLTIIKDGQELDMGTRFDFFGELSHTENPSISTQAQANRSMLKNLMHSQGFINLHLEWWHYTLENEPFPDTYFNFPVN